MKALGTVTGQVIGVTLDSEKRQGKLTLNSSRGVFSISVSGEPYRVLAGLENDHLSKVLVFGEWYTSKGQGAAMEAKLLQPLDGLDKLSIALLQQVLSQWLTSDTMDQIWKDKTRRKIRVYSS